MRTHHGGVGFQQGLPPLGSSRRRRILVGVLSSNRRLCNTTGNIIDIGIAEILSLGLWQRLDLPDHVHHVAQILRQRDLKGSVVVVVDGAVFLMRDINRRQV